ncbi:Uncharacterised protein [Mycobacteroides abscessus subsp. abscessus]|nr:Uncharacterised protein [Mycobacteroides abscessus subsp. abscessus]
MSWARPSVAARMMWRSKSTCSGFMRLYSPKSTNPTVPSAASRMLPGWGSPQKSLSWNSDPM